MFCRFGGWPDNNCYEAVGLLNKPLNAKSKRIEMSSIRSDAISKIISDLESFEITPNDYFEIPKLQNFIDTVLSGKLDTLACYSQTVGWSHIAGAIQELLPVEFTAFQAQERVQGFILPEVKHLLAESDVDSTPNPTDWFWDFVHPRIKSLSQPRFDAGFHADAVESAFKEVNDAVKRIFKEATGKELDGAGLMTTAFSLGNPVIKLSQLESETDRNIQQGYMQIFAGSMVGIRNPKAHSNLNTELRKALHFISLASLLMCKVDERI